MSNAAVTLTPPARRTVLVVDDDEPLAHACKRVLERFGWEARVAHDANRAMEILLERTTDAVVCDINLPGANGVNLLEFVRQADIDVPFLLVTGDPTIRTAIDAVELGAAEYMVKPVAPDELHARLERACIAHRERHSVLPESPGSGLLPRPPGVVAFEQALEKLYLVFQPIYDLRSGELYAFEALMRSNHETMKTPLALLDAAEEFGRLHELGRRVRNLASDALPRAPDGTYLFVNLHAADLQDVGLYAEVAPLSGLGKRIVLEITERASMNDVSEPHRCMQKLRRFGFRIAIDDLGAGYAGLNSLATLEPEIVKLDMSLVRNIHVDPTRERVVDSMVTLCHGLGIKVVAEGIETPSELNVVRALGCDFGQGYGLGRPAPSFDVPRILRG